MLLGSPVRPLPMRFGLRRRPAHAPLRWRPEQPGCLPPPLHVGLRALAHQPVAAAPPRPAPHKPGPAAVLMRSSVSKPAAGPVRPGAAALVAGLQQRPVAVRFAPALRHWQGRLQVPARRAAVPALRQEQEPRPRVVQRTSAVQPARLVLPDLAGRGLALRLAVVLPAVWPNVGWQKPAGQAAVPPEQESVRRARLRPLGLAALGLLARLAVAARLSGLAPVPLAARRGRRPGFAQAATVQAFVLAEVEQPAVGQPVAGAKAVVPRAVGWPVAAPLAAEQQVAAPAAAGLAEVEEAEAAPAGAAPAEVAPVAAAPAAAGPAEAGPAAVAPVAAGPSEVEGVAAEPEAAALAVAARAAAESVVAAEGAAIAPVRSPSRPQAAAGC